MPALFTSIDALERSLSFHGDRHAVLASNVANIDTPGYRALELERRAPGAAFDEALAVTQPRHLSAGLGASDARLTQTDAAGGDTGLDGNTVNLERELAKMDANRVRYSAASELASRRLALLRYAAADGGA